MKELKTHREPAKVESRQQKVAEPQRQKTVESPRPDRVVYDPNKDNDFGPGTPPEISDEVLADADFNDIINILKKTSRRGDIRRK